MKIPLGNLTGVPARNIEAAFSLLGLTEEERRVVLLSSGIAKSTSSLARQAKLPWSTVRRIVGRLAKRGIVNPIRRERGAMGRHKDAHWRSDTRKAARTLAALLR